MKEEEFKKELSKRWKNLKIFPTDENLLNCIWTLKGSKVGLSNRFPSISLKALKKSLKNKDTNKTSKEIVLLNHIDNEVSRSSKTEDYFYCSYCDKSVHSEYYVGNILTARVCVNCMSKDEDIRKEMEKKYGQ